MGSSCSSSFTKCKHGGARGGNPFTGTKCCFIKNFCPEYVSCHPDYPYVCRTEEKTVDGSCRVTGGKCECVGFRKSLLMMSPVEADSIEEFAKTAPDFEKYDDKKSS